MNPISEITGINMPEPKFQKYQTVYVCTIDEDKIESSVFSAIISDINALVWIDPDSDIVRSSYEYSLLIDHQFNRLYSESSIFSHKEEAVDYFSTETQNRQVALFNELKQCKDYSVDIHKALVNLEEENSKKEPISMNSTVYSYSFFQGFRIIEGSIVGMSGRICLEKGIKEGFRYIIENDFYDDYNLPSDKVFISKKEALQNALLENDSNIEKISKKIKYLNKALTDFNNVI